MESLFRFLAAHDLLGAALTVVIAYLIFRALIVIAYRLGWLDRWLDETDYDPYP